MKNGQGSGVHAQFDHASPAKELERHIGPALREGLAEMLETSDTARIGHAVALYRERVGTAGLFENTPYSDVHGTLQALSDAGFASWVCTSKPRVYAERILAHFDLARYIRGVYGCALQSPSATVSRSAERDRESKERPA